MAEHTNSSRGRSRAGGELEVWRKPGKCEIFPMLLCYPISLTISIITVYGYLWIFMDIPIFGEYELSILISVPYLAHVGGSYERV